MLEQSRVASLVDVEIRQWRTLNIANLAFNSISASSKRNTTDGAEVGVGTIEVDPRDNPGGFEKSDPLLVDSLPPNAPYHYLTYLFINVTSRENPVEVTSHT